MDKYLLIILLFFSYSFIGWCCEVILGLIREHKFVNRGFLIGPVCPIYGIGGLLVIFLLKGYAHDRLIFFIMAIIICASLEYFTSYIMEKIFKNRWWDYSDFKYNINGRICLEFAIPFGVIAYVMYFILNPILFNLYNKIPIDLQQLLCIFLISVFILDLILSFNIILSLRKISSYMRGDSTEVITKKVREILSKQNYLHRRLIESFPKMQIFNKITEIKMHIRLDRERLKFEKQRIKRRQRAGKKGL